VDRTIITVAHRFSTIMASDRIIVLDQGRIVEFGSHDNLLNKNGFYSNLYWEQFKNNALNPLVDI
jgi:ABC-type multidrug transport system fused ATPase/permease subunit